MDRGGGVKVGRVCEARGWRDGLHGTAYHLVGAQCSTERTFIARVLLEAGGAGRCRVLRSTCCLTTDIKQKNLVCGRTGWRHGGSARATSRQQRASPGGTRAVWRGGGAARRVVLEVHLPCGVDARSLYAPPPLHEPLLAP